MSTTIAPRIVILGAGFAGVYSYLSIRKQFRDAAITLVNRTNHFLFTPLLHEVATGSIGHHQVVESLREIIHRDPLTDLHVAEVTRIDFEAQTVTTTVGELAYDYLILALGATTAFYGIPGAREHGRTLKSLGDAIRLRNHVIETFERASSMTDPAQRRALLSFAVVGGGPTGVELAAELMELFRETFHRYYHNLDFCQEVRLTLVNKSPDLLVNFDPRLRTEAQQRLEHLGVIIRNSADVVAASAQGLTLADGEHINAQTLVWVAGVVPETVEFAQSIELRQGRIVVDRSLRVTAYPNVIALGDLAAAQDEQGRSLPLMAQVAFRQGAWVGRLLRALHDGRAPLPVFRYHSLGTLVSVGQWYAIGQIMGIHLHGRFTWWLWRTVYLLRFISVSKKIKIAVDWTVGLFSRRDITRA